MIKNANETMKHPRMLLWCMLIPQLLLLLLNWRVWSIVGGEMSTEQVRMAVTVGSYEAALLLAASILFVALTLLKKPVHLLLCLIILLAGIGYLWLFTAYSARIIPTTIADWMLPGSQVIYYQYALIMPALFYAGLRLACIPLRVPRAADIGVSLLTVVAIPIAWFTGIQLLGSFWRFVDPAIYVILTFAIGSTVLLLLAFLRMLTHLYLALSSVNWGRPVMLFIASLIAPIGGLLLNRTIPFPYDFQSQSVYILTCLNALFLLLPFAGTLRRNAIVWGLRCITYPFTLYFFIVFLPFLPLSLLAMIAAGAGFLILAPTLLFIMHTRTLIEEARQLRKVWGMAPVVIGFLLCVSAIPLGLTGRALLDKQALTQALDVAYRPDYTAGQVSINRTALKRTLRRLQDVKHGIYLPFITDGYDAIVLDGMILPDPKREHLETLFFGKPFERQHKQSRFSDVFNPAAQRRHARHRNRVNLPPRNVKIADITQQATTTNDTATTLVTLTLANNGNNAAEFVTDISLPDGVFITGYWLHIGDSRVPGRIVDKKAAMWVYHMIRDQTRRDPGMLVYQNDGTVRLSVFPFSANETRQTEIAFSYPAGMAPEWHIGDQIVTPPREAPPLPTSYMQRRVDTSTLLIPATTAVTLPTTTLPAYLHLIVDCSEQAQSVAPAFGALVERLALENQEIAHCKITLVNYAFKHITPELIPISETKRVLSENQSALPFRGGLSPERVIKSVLLNLRDNAVLTENGIPMTPVFVVVKATHSPLLRDEDGFGPFADLISDSNAYYVMDDKSGFDAYSFRAATAKHLSVIPLPTPVVLLRAGNSYAAVRADQTSVVNLHSDQPPEYFDSSTQNYRPLDQLVSLPADSKPAQGLALMHDWARTRFVPKSAEDNRRDLLSRSREHGILIPDTAYIVVENQAQWDMLERAEDKSLKADSKLAFDEFIESPAPPIWLLAPFALLLMMRQKQRPRRALH